MILSPDQTLAESPAPVMGARVLSADASAVSALSTNIFIKGQEPLVMLPFEVIRDSD